MKVRNMTSRNGNIVANQFIISGHKHHGSADNLPMITNRVETFKSYDSAIVEIEYMPEGRSVTLDETYWDYSVTTGKYRNLFLGETKKETEKKIKSGEYKLANLND